MPFAALIKGRNKMKSPREEKSTPAPRKGVPDELTDSERGIRIQKAMAEAGLAARRECEQYVIEGRVRVNGKLVNQLPAWVDPMHDKLTVDGRPVRLRAPVSGPMSRKTYILLNKPRHVITTNRDPEGRRTVLDLIDMDGKPRLFPVGRLDADSTGLLLLTNDGELADRLTHPRYGITKQYNVSIRGRLDQDDIQILKKGLFLVQPRRSPGAPAARRAKVSDVSLLGYGTGGNGDRTRLLITLQEGQNREVRRLLARLGFNVRRLERVAIGSLSIKGLGSGQWRMLSEVEVKRLKREAGLIEPATGAADRPARRPAAGASDRREPGRAGPVRRRP